ncbi:MAG: hypothetical protein HC817_02140 [Saprospiraceae bacterium]|nr:hypothetical protein [Saprospiraceae bacterium]
MDYKSIQLEQENNQKGILLSVALHILLAMAFFFIPMGSGKYNIEPPKIEVQLPPDLMGGGAAIGLPDVGQGDEPAPGKPDPNIGGSSPTPVPDEPTPTPVKPVIAKPKPTPSVPSKRVETTEDPNAVALRRAQEDARRKDEEKKYQEQQAARERQRQVDEENRRAQAAKDKFGKIGTGFGQGSQSGNQGGGGTGGGLGNTGRTGSGGRPDGNPDGRNTSGAPGVGRGIGGGLGGRAVVTTPRLQENSQKSGKVVLKVCVDASGSVVSSDYQASGSNTLDDDLVEAAKRNARQYKFAKSDFEKQCGTITYNFIVK